MTPAKVLENRVRRVAERRGLQIVKSRRRDPRAVDYGTYKIIDQTDGSEVGAPDLASVAEYLALLDVLDDSVTSRETDFAAVVIEFDLIGLDNALELLLKKLRNADHPASALNLGLALEAFIREFRE